MKRRNTITDPRVADAESRLILAENDMYDLLADAKVYALTLPQASAKAFMAGIAGLPVPADLPSYEAAEFDRLFWRRMNGIRRSLLRHGSIVAGEKS